MIQLLAGALARFPTERCSHALEGPLRNTSYCLLPLGLQARPKKPRLTPPDPLQSNGRRIFGAVAAFEGQL